MITITRLNDVAFVLNSDLIETIENTPDTLIRLTSGQKFVVQESAAEVLDRIRRFRHSLRIECELVTEPPAPLAGRRE